MLHHVYRRAGFPYEWIKRLSITDSGDTEEAILLAEQRIETAATQLRCVLDQLLADTPEGSLRTRLYNARKVFFQKNKIAPAIKGLFPPLDTAISSYLQAVDARHAAQCQADVLWQEGLIKGYAALQEVARTEAFQRGLLFSSHALLDRLPNFIQTPPEQFSAKERHIALGLARYLIRGATRCTPLNHWAVVAIAEQPEHGIFQQKIIKTTPNVALLEAFYGVLLREPSFYRSLQIRLNPSLKTAENGHLRWWFFNGKEEAVQQSPLNELTEFIVEWMEDHAGNAPWADLAEALSEAAATATETAERHLLQYIDTGLLEWVLPERGLSPSWAGRLYQYIGTISRPGPVLEAAAFTLQWLRTAARSLPFQPVVEARQTLADTAVQLRTFFSDCGTAAPDIPAEQLFYEDVLVIQEDVLSESARSQLFDAVAEIWNSAPAQPLSVVRKKLAPQSPELVPLPITRSLGMTLSLFRRESGEWNAVLETLYPASGKLMGRWSHLLPPLYTEQLQADYRHMTDTAVLTWYQAFNANMHPFLTSKTLQIPGDGRSADGIRLSEYGIQDSSEGDLCLVHQAEGRRLRLTDPGLEAFESRPWLIKLLLLAGTPRISRELLPSPVWSALKKGILYRPRQMNGPIITSRAAWTFFPPVAALIPSPGWRRRWTKSGLPRSFMLHSDTEPPLFLDLDSPLMCHLLEKHIEKTALVYIEEVLPEPESYAVEVAMENWDIHIRDR